MTSKENKDTHQIPPPSWEGVRGIYKKLSDEFNVLTSTFNVSIGPQTKLHLDHLIIAIDEVLFSVRVCLDERLMN